MATIDGNELSFMNEVVRLLGRMLTMKEYKIAQQCYREQKDPRTTCRKLGVCLAR